MNRDKSIRDRIYEIRRRLATQRRSRHGHVADSMIETTMLERFVIDVSAPKVIYEIAAPLLFRNITSFFRKPRTSSPPSLNPGVSRTRLLPRSAAEWPMIDRVLRVARLLLVSWSKTE